MLLFITQCTEHIPHILSGGNAPRTFAKTLSRLRKEQRLGGVPKPQNRPRFSRITAAPPHALAPGR
jgi:hypothetical protein